MNRKRRNNRGYTLAEVLIAIAVISVGGFGLLAACYASMQYQHDMLDQAERQKVASYAYALFRQHCSQNPDFLTAAEDEEEESPPLVFPEGEALGDYPADARWAWRIKIAPHESLSGLYEITVLVFDMREADETNAIPEDGNALYTLHTFFSRRE